MAYSRVIMSATLLVGMGFGASPSVDAAPSNQKFSEWQFYSDVSSQGMPVCLIMSAVANKDIGQNIVIKGFANSQHLVIDLYKDKWNRPQGSNVKVMFDFLDNQPLTLSAYADAHILDIEIPTEDTASFLLQLVERPAIQVIFPDDEDEGTWVVDSTGARGAVQKMVSCLQAK
jgi:hypothetical protein